MTTKHVWRTKKEFFHQLVNGEKTLEVRVGYFWVKKVQAGDIISFENYGPNSFLVRRVSRYDDFEQMLNKEGSDKVFPGRYFDSALHILRELYPPKKEALGVFVFDLEFILDTKAPQSTLPAAPEEAERIFLCGSKLLNDGKNKLFAKMVSESYMITDWITEDYPGHTSSFFEKYVPGIFSGEREIISCYLDNKIAATAVLKKTPEEKKVSTLFVKSKYRQLGIATELLERSFTWLGTSRPLITIADYKLPQFKGVIERYGWEETQVLELGYYNDHSREYVFNGEIR